MSPTSDPTEVKSLICYMLSSHRLGQCLLIHHPVRCWALKRRPSMGAFRQLSFKSPPKCAIISQLDGLIGQFKDIDLQMLKVDIKAEAHSSVNLSHTKSVALCATPR